MSKCDFSDNLFLRVPNGAQISRNSNEVWENGIVSECNIQWRFKDFLVEDFRRALRIYLWKDGFLRALFKKKSQNYCSRTCISTQQAGHRSPPQCKSKGKKLGTLLPHAFNDRQTNLCYEVCAVLLLWDSASPPTF